MSREPRVSVVVPAYDSAPWVRECVESVVAQTEKDLEVVVVDDGSRDDTAAIARSVPGPVVVVTQENAGRGAARDRGLSLARGRFVAFLDADDALLPTSVAERVALLEARADVGWVCTDATEFDATGDLRPFLAQFPWLDEGGDDFERILRGCFPLTSTVMARRDLLQRAGRFDARYRYGEDVDYFLRLALLSPVAVLGKPLTRRRMHPGQAVSSTRDRWASRVAIYENLRDGAFDIAPRRRQALLRALKHARFKTGEWHWQQYETREARRLFLGSLGANRWSAPALAYAAASWLPSAALRGLRRLRRGGA